MFQDKSLNLLKNIVILMGIILIVGVLLLFKIAVTKLTPPTEHSCINQELQLDSASIKNMTIGDGKLFLHVVNKNTDKIIFFDYCDTEKINQINFIK